MKRAFFIPVALLVPTFHCYPFYEEEPVEEIALYGYLFDTPYPVSWEELVVDAGIEALDIAGNLLAEGEQPYPVEYPGYFKIHPLPPDSHIHLKIDGGEGYVTTIISGDTPPDNLYLDVGSLFVMPEEDAGEILASFGEAGESQVIDPTEEGNGGFIYGFFEDEEGTAGSKVIVTGSDGLARSALYAGPDGKLDDTLESTSASGIFAVFSLPEGGAEVYISIRGEEPLPDPFDTWITEDGITWLGEYHLEP